MPNEGNYCLQKCTGYCCTRYVVLITTEDLIRILKNIPLRVEQFITVYQANENTKKYFPPIYINSEEVALGLKQRQDGSCIFFLKEIGMCGIHFFKPMVCHTYPFTLDANDNLIRLENICPEDWEPNDKDELKRYIHQAWYEMEINKKKVEYWNKTHPDGGFYEFINFILNYKP